MRYKTLLSLTIALGCLQANAQKKNAIAFAITAEKQGQVGWTEVKLLNLSTGEVLRSVYEKSHTPQMAIDARSGRTIKVTDERGAVTDDTKMPFSTFSAACAFDKRHNRLYYTPMFINELRYIDLAGTTPKIYYFEKENLSKATNLNNEANHITRMVIGADGDGYALSNDGNHLVRFTTGRKAVITDLGALQDDAANEKISIHNRCTSWGGDMIAAANGDLYVISAFHAVFKVNVQSRVATYVTNINGLPAQFTTNGAAIDDDGSLVVSSANSMEGYYRVDLKNWQATKMAGNGTVFNTSDLANGNLAFGKEPQQSPTPVSRVARVDRIGLYPNPVSENVFRVSFDNNEWGRYSIQLVDLLGRKLSEKIVDIGTAGQVAEVRVDAALARGVYMVKVLNNNKKTVFSDKIMLE